jgi:hypothetical protein
MILSCDESPVIVIIADYGSVIAIPQFVCGSTPAVLCWIEVPGSIASGSWFISKISIAPL